VSIPVFEIPSFSLLNGDDATKDKVNFLDEIFSRRYPEGFTKEDIQYADLPNEEVVCLNYTSGTAGFCKGVMITANNFAGNVTYGKNSDCSSAENEPWLFCPCPMCMAARLIFSTPSLSGCTSHWMGVIPTLHNLIQALQEVKPKLIITVPLTLEKIYKRRIFPVIDRPIVKWFLMIPGINKLILYLIKKLLMQSLGGNFREVIDWRRGTQCRSGGFFIQNKISIHRGIRNDRVRTAYLV